MYIVIILQNMYYQSVFTDNTGTFLGSVKCKSPCMTYWDENVINYYIYIYIYIYIFYLIFLTFKLTLKYVYYYFLN